MYVVLFFFLMIRRPPRSTRMTHSFPTRRSSDLAKKGEAARALSAAFASSMIGGVFGAVVLTGAVLVARPIVLAFGTGEMLMLSVIRSEEHTSELQSLMRISYAVFCLKKKKHTIKKRQKYTYRNTTKNTTN